jgi:hypothetical protein
MKQPSPQEIREMVKSRPFQWYLERLAYHTNAIDTVRNAQQDNLNLLLAAKMAIEIIENTLSDIYQNGELEKFQKKQSEEEQNPIKNLQEIDY